MRQIDRKRFTDPSVIEKIKEIENSKEVQARLKSAREGIKQRTFSFEKITWQVVMAAFFILLILSKLDLTFILVFIMFFFMGPIKKFLDKRRNEKSKAYVDNFLLPTLNEIFPDTEVKYHEGLKINVLEKFFPYEEKFFGNCHIIFEDEFNTEFSNAQAVHYVSDSDGNDERVVVFCGQVLLINMHTNIKGHIRVVPVVKKGMFGKKKHGIYGEIDKDEREIETESIEFNESYSIFSTDNFYSRLILDPNIMEILNNWKRKMRVILYMNEDYISVAFNSGEYLFEVPKTIAEIEKLSLSSEYEEIREKLVDLYELIDLIKQKL